MGKMRANFTSQGKLICIGKLVANLIREQDNLLLEVMLPRDFNSDHQSQSAMEEAARILAPFLIVSNHMIFDFGEENDFKTSLQSCVKTLLRSIQMLDFNGLIEEGVDADLKDIISGIMPKIFFTSAQSLDQIKETQTDSGFNKCETERCLLDLALLVYFKH